MAQPSQMTAFDALYQIAARDGREEALFGCGLELDCSCGETQQAGVYLQCLARLLGR